MTGHAYRRFKFKKRTYKNQYLGPFINHEMNRCIQCYRCVRFYKDYAGGKDLMYLRQEAMYILDGTKMEYWKVSSAETLPKFVQPEYSRIKHLKQHYTRKWDLTTAPSICQHCSVGCNIIAGERYGELRSITNRYNSEVNGYFICDRGRFGYEFVNAPNRIRKPILNGEEADKEKVLTEISRLLYKLQSYWYWFPTCIPGIELCLENPGW